MADKFENHLKKCRCCFSSFDSGGAKIKITEKIEKSFEELTNLKLPIKHNQSSIICLECSKKLKDFSKFRKLMVQNQNELNEFLAATGSCNFFDAEIDYSLLKSVTVKCEVINVHDDMFKEISLPNGMKSLSQEASSSRKLIQNIKQEKEVVIEDCSSFDDYDDHFGDNTHESNDEKEKTDESRQEKEEKVEPDIFANKRLNNFKIESKFYNPKDYIKLQCDYCSFKAPFQAAYDKHLKVVHKAMKNDVKCKICSKMISRSGIKSHILRLHDLRKDLECDTCGGKYFEKKILIKHVLSHIPVELREKYVCDICNSAYARKDNLISHMKINHMKFKAKLVCSYCGKIFVHRKHLSTHVNLVHKKIKNHKCKFCKINFNESSKLKDHLLSNHQAETLGEAFICDVCGVSFSYKKGLSKHKRQHSEALFKCTQCNKGFTYKFILMNHIRNVHENLRQEECSYCLKQFFDKRQVRKHIALVHERVKVCCPVQGCPRDFHRIDYCRRHIRNDHTELDETQKIIMGNEASRRFKVASK